MAGRGKTGKHSTKSSKKKHAVRKTGEQREHESLTKPALRRLARRGGVKRIGLGSIDEMRDYAENFLESVLRATLAYNETKRKDGKATVTALDVVYALKRTGKTLYGYGF